MWSTIPPDLTQAAAARLLQCLAQGVGFSSFVSDINTEKLRNIQNAGWLVRGDVRIVFSCGGVQRTTRTMRGQIGLFGGAQAERFVGATEYGA